MIYIFLNLIKAINIFSNFNSVNSKNFIPLCYGSLKSVEEFQYAFCISDICNLLKKLKKLGTKLVKRGKRKVPMYCFGSTVGVARTPRILVEKKMIFIPRPYRFFKPISSKRVEFEKMNDLRVFAHFVEKITLEYLQIVKEEWATEAYSYLLLSKKITPSSCLIMDTGFNFMSLNGDMGDSDEGIQNHVDDQDYVNLVLHLGTCTSGGCTIFCKYLPNRDKPRKIFEVPFEHGTFQISRFSHILHGTDKWKGVRCSLNFGLKKKVLNFFKCYGTYHYKKHIVDEKYILKNEIIEMK